MKSTTRQSDRHTCKTKSEKTQPNSTTDRRTEKQTHNKKSTKRQTDRQTQDQSKKGREGMEQYCPKNVPSRTSLTGALNVSFFFCSFFCSFVYPFVRLSICPFIRLFSPCARVAKPATAPLKADLVPQQQQKCFRNETNNKKKTLKLPTFNCTHTQMQLCRYWD